MSLLVSEDRKREIAEARRISEKAQAEGRGLTAEERAQQKMLLSGVASSLTAVLGQRKGGGAPAQNGNGGQPRETKTGRRGRGREAAFTSYLRGKPLTGEEERALQVDEDPAGGYLVPDAFHEELIQALDDLVYMRQWGSVTPVIHSSSLGIPTLDADPEDADWTAELSTGGEDDQMKFGKRELRPHPLAKRIKVSRTLLRQAPNVEKIVQERLAAKIGATMEKAYLLGDGAGKPLGVFTPSESGIPLNRDVATGNSATAVTMAGLLNAKMAVKSAYWRAARWLFHPDALVQLVTLKDENGNYIWIENARVGEPTTLLGMPVFFSEYVPNTYTSGLYAGILGDFSNYWIVDALNVSVMRLDQLYAESNQVGYIARMESDGAPVRPEAFVRVKLG